MTLWNLLSTPLRAINPLKSLIGLVLIAFLNISVTETFCPIVRGAPPILAFPRKRVK